MCLIINRPPNKPLDFEKFQVAVKNNPHGYGLSVANGDGTLYTVRDHHKPDPESLYKLIQEEFIEQDVMLHLRYTTVGKTILRNAHPFPVLEYNKDGVDLRMAHNGTIHGYTAKNGLSDTRQFVQTLVRPLFKRLIKGMHVEEILNDKFIQALLNDKLPARSVLSFIDGYGNNLQINAQGNGGYFEDEVFYSNKYSFDPTHREPQELVGNAYGHWEGNTWRRNSETNVTKYEPKKHAKDTEVEKFTEKYFLSEEEFNEITDDFIDQLFNERPEDAKLLMKELLFLFDVKKTKLENLERKMRQ